VKKIRKRLTYANVMSSIAVFLVIGGASALAATHLGKNSVGTKQLKNNAVTTAKIKKNAITGSKVKDGSLTGSDINLGTVGTVPSAANAGHASSADSAGNANTVGGQSVTKVFKTLVPGQKNISVASIAGFNITASCESGNVDAVLDAPVGLGSVLTDQGNGNSEGTYFEYDAAEAGGAASINLDGNPDNTYGQVSLSAALSNGTVISGELGYDYDTFGGESPERCVVYGEITSG
jgi:hypothetical protein